jgi:hypothetical protein
VLKGAENPETDYLFCWSQSWVHFFVQTSAVPRLLSAYARQRSKRLATSNLAFFEGAGEGAEN